MAEFKHLRGIASTLHSFNLGTILCIGLPFSLSAARGYASEQRSALTEPCSFQTADPDLNADDGADVHAGEKYTAAVGRIFKRDGFDELDCLADSLRTSKARFAGGMWKLRALYGGLESPTQHATEADWKEHLNRLNRWVAEKPRSITARIALAEAYTDYAWDARGEGAASTVSDSGSRLFAERSEKAKQILGKASALRAKCPEWYVAMESVALAQGWERGDARALVEQAKSSEPEYYYVYRMYAQYLLPKWYGEEGETERFAAEVADSLGGNKGDVAYFQIAGNLVCDCEDQPLYHMSWPRIRRGFDALDKQYGVSLTNLNLLALMAVKVKDSVVADHAFRRIGEQWSETDWKRRESFDTSKTWAAQTAPAEAWRRSLEDEAEKNLRAAQGPGYQVAFDKKFDSLMQECMKTAGSDGEPFEMLIRVGEGGTIERLMVNPTTTVSGCLFQNLMKLQMAKATPFPPPPKASYWVRFNLDSATSSSNNGEAH